MTHPSFDLCEIVAQMNSGDIVKTAIMLQSVKPAALLPLIASLIKEETTLFVIIVHQNFKNKDAESVSNKSKKRQVSPTILERSRL